MVAPRSPGSGLTCCLHEVHRTLEVEARWDRTSGAAGACFACCIQAGTAGNSQDGSWCRSPAGRRSAGRHVRARRGRRATVERGRACQYGIRCATPYDGDGKWKGKLEVGTWVGAAYPVVCQRHEALAYPLLRVDVADGYVKRDEDHETQEDGPLDDEALLSGGLARVFSRWKNNQPHTLVYQYGTMRPFSTTKPSGVLVGSLPLSDVVVACRCTRYESIMCCVYVQCV